MKKVLDSFALLVYLKKEDNFDKVKEYFRQAKESNQPLLMNEINIGEVYYIIAKERSLKEAEDFLTFLPILPIKLFHNKFSDIIAASKIKAEYSISFADCFTVATALKEGGNIITGDPEFRKIEKIVTVEWL